MSDEVHGCEKLDMVRWKGEFMVFGRLTIETIERLDSDVMLCLKVNQALIQAFTKGKDAMNSVMQHHGLSPIDFGLGPISTYLITHNELPPGALICKESPTLTSTEA